LLPPSEPNERFFRLIAAVLADLRSVDPTERQAALWRAILYFSYWAVRLTGILPELPRLSAASSELVDHLASRPIAQLAALPWSKETAADLRRLLHREIEYHIERKLITVPLMEAL